MSSRGPDLSVLDDNVRRLVTRCYVPVLPRPAFRAELRSTLVAETRRLHGRGAPVPPLAGKGWLVVALAAGLLLALLAVRELGGTAHTSTPAPGGDSSAELAVEGPGTAREPGPEDEPAHPLELAPAERDERAPVAAGPGEEPAPFEEAAPVGLSGRVLGPDGEPVEAFRVLLLREQQGSEFETAREREFEHAGGSFHWPEPPAGPHEVFVHAAGLALARAGELELGGGTSAVVGDVRLEPGEAISGFVVDPSTGAPVLGARVTSLSDTPQGFLSFTSEELVWSPARAPADASGAFTLEHLRPGIHDLLVTAPGYAPVWLEEVETGTRDVLVELGEGGSVAGVVLREDGSPWEGARLIATLLDPKDTRQTLFSLAHADVDGNYRFDALPTQPLLVIQTDSRTRPRVRPVEVEKGETVRLDFTYEDEGARLHGFVRRAGGEPLAGWHLSIFERTALYEGDTGDEFVATSTFSDGSYAFDDVAPGSYVLFAVGRMGHWLRYLGEVDVPPTTDVRHDLEVAGLRLVASVVADLGGEPVARAPYLLMRDDADGVARFAGFGEADESGRIIVEDLNPGTYSLRTQSTHLGLGSASSEPLALGPDHEAEIELRLPPGGGFEVVVTDAEDVPLAGVTLTFIDAEGEAHSFGNFPQTDERGRLVVVGANPGTFEIIPTQEGRVVAPPIQAECSSGALTRVRIRQPAQALEVLPQGDDSR